MFFVNSVEPYKQPDASRVHLLTGIRLEKSLIFDEIMDITNSPYSNENWSKLSYFVTKDSLRPYDNEHLGRIADRKIVNGEWLIDKTSVNCLYNETYLRMPTVCDWTRHFSFFTINNFLGCIGIYALQLSRKVSKYMALRQIANVAQYHIISNNPFNHFMTAIQKGENWEVVFGEIIPAVVIPGVYQNSRRVRIYLFKEPNILFDVLIREGNVRKALREEYEIRVRV